MSTAHTHPTHRRATRVVPRIEPTLRRRLAKAFSLKAVPTKYAIVLSLVCGALTVLNQTTFPDVIGYSDAIKTAVTWALAGFAFLGIGPVVGPKFRTVLKLPPAIATGISMLLLIGLTVAQQDAALPYRAIIIGFVQIAGGLGFEPAFIPTV